MPWLGAGAGLQILVRVFRLREGRGLKVVVRSQGGGGAGVPGPGQLKEDLAMAGGILQWGGGMSVGVLGLWPEPLLQRGGPCPGHVAEGSALGGGLWVGRTGWGSHPPSSGQDR